MDYFLNSTGLILIVLRGHIPVWLSVPFSNAIIVTGALLGYMGLESFLEKKSSQIHNYLLIVLFILNVNIIC
jgi:hypothetical protein